MEPTSTQLKNRELVASGQAPTSNFRDLAVDTSAADSLSSYMTANPLAQTEKTIMEQYATRKKALKEGSAAQASLIKSEADTAIEDAKVTNARELTAEQESQRGFAQNTAMVRAVQDTGEKRIRTLAKTRDELLLQNNIAEADRYDALIGKEEEAITNARQSWITNMLNLSNEKRAISGEKRAMQESERAALSFETPEQKRNAEFTFANKTAVQNLQSAAPDAGITVADSYDAAIEKYRKSGTYNLNQQKAEAELDAINANIKQSLASANASYASAAKSNADRRLLETPAGGGLATPELSNAFENIKARFGSKFQVDNANANFNKLVAEGNVEEAKTYLKTLVKTGSNADEIARLDARESAISSLQDIKASLDAYKAAGGNTSLLKGTLETVAQKVGNTTDPKLAAIGISIQAAVQNYRRAISGAAFTEQEAKEYDKIFPNFWSTAELNDAKIAGALSTFKNNQDSYYRNAMGTKNYNTVFGEKSYSANASGAPGRTLDNATGVENSPSLSSTPAISSGNMFSGFFGK